MKSRLLEVLVLAIAAVVVARAVSSLLGPLLPLLVGLLVVGGVVALLFRR